MRARGIAVATALIATLGGCSRLAPGGSAAQPVADGGRGDGGGGGGGSGGGESLGDLIKRALPAPPAPQVVTDKDLTVPAHAWHAPGFVLPSPRTVHVAVEGKKHAEKGFRLYVMTAEDLLGFEKKKPFHDAPSFEALPGETRSHAIDRSDTLPPGSWTVVVYNSENARMPMVVHLRVVVDPP
jgi:hypothetical protein